MLRVLVSYGEPFVYGGQETFSCNLYKYSDKKKIRFDFYTPFNIQNNSLHYMLKNEKFYHDDKSFNKFFRKFNYIIGLKKFLKNHKNNYDIIHINSGSSFNLAIGAYIAKKYGIKKVIVHSHASGTSSVKHKYINKLFEKYYKYCDVYLACSKEAAEYHFPINILKNKAYEIITNGIDMKRYTFNEDTRQKYRNMLNINNNEILLGNVGRLSSEKNQVFLLKILKKLISINPQYKLLLIGDGPDENVIKSMIGALNIDDNVILLKKRDDVCNLLMAMDLFLFPSIYEGLGIALIEAEASGIPSICSSGIPKQAIINDNCFCIDEFNEKKWIKKIKNTKLERKVNPNLINLYSIDNTIKQIDNVYFGGIDKK